MSVTEARTGAARSRFIIALVVVFGASRLIYWMVGIRFDAWALTNSWQLLPEGLLKHDLVGSLWYLHSQPPLFNAFIGATLHLPHAHGLINLEFVACTLALTVLLFLTMLELAVPMRLGFAVAVLFAISPSTVLYENWMYYSYPVALMSVASVWCFARYIRTKRTGYAAAVATMLALLALTRASYHLFFVLAGALAVLVAADKGKRRVVAVAVGIPVLVVAGLYVKNYVLFGEPDASSWLGMNMAHMVLGNEPNQVRADVDRGELSRQALIPPFIELGGYSVRRAHTGVPALDRPLKQPGVNNYNNLAYIDISRRYEKDSLAFIRRHPDLYARLVADSFRTMFVPASDFIGVQLDKPNFAKLRTLVNAENKLLGQFGDYQQPLAGTATAAAPEASDIAWLVVLAYAATLFAGVGAAVLCVRRKRWSTPRATLVFLAFVVGYATLSSNMFELGENMRFRLETDPLVLAAATALLAYGYRRLRAARGPRAHGVAEPILLTSSVDDVHDEAATNEDSLALEPTETLRS